MKPKNLLFIFTDQQRYDTLAAYGNTKIKVPNLNRLAEQSAVFEKAYVTQPLCTPSRASIMTGLYPHNHGSCFNNIALSHSSATIAELLEGNGYNRAYMGKWHLGNETVRQRGFDEWVSTEEYRGYVTKEEYRSINSSYTHFLREAGFMPDVEDGDFSTYSRSFVSHLPEYYSKPAFTAREACRFIRDNKNDNFVLYVNFLEPHPPYNSAFDDMYDWREVDLPPRFYDQPDENTPLRYSFARRFWREVGRMKPLQCEEDWRRLIAKYWGAVSLVDKYAGRIIDELDHQGIRDDTIIVFTSDHGDMMGDFRICQKSIMFDPSSRVPLLIRVPGITESQPIIREPVSLVDLLPTLLDAMDVEIPAHLDGKSLLPYIKGESLYDNDVFIEWNGDEGEDIWFKLNEDPEMKSRIDAVYGATIRTVVTPDGWKLSLSSKGEHELYHITKDPKELQNLYFKPEHSDVRQLLTNKILNWMQSSRDHAIKEFESLKDDKHI